MRRAKWRDGSTFEDTVGPVTALHPVGVRPGLASYVRDALARGAFLRELTRARVQASTHGMLLGPLWLLLTPLLTSVLYFVVFGMLLGAQHQMDNYTLFLLVGVLLFTFTSRGLSAGAASLSRQRDLVRALPFPRIVLPVSAVGVEIPGLAWSVALLALVAAVTTGVHATWLLALLGVLALVVMSIGGALLLARVTSGVPDTAGLLPFGLRALAYLSGAYFPLTIAGHSDSLLVQVLSLSPLAVVLEVVRTGLAGDFASTATWMALACWTAGLLVAGVLAFWRGEPRYGSD